MKFIDVFAGCGGMSLGLMKAGLEGVLALEADPMAFETFKKNLIESNVFGKFSWPLNTIPCKPHTLSKNFLRKYESELKKLRGKVDLVVGGPPCQGFSTYGNRDPHDPRNQLPYRYIDLIKLVSPNYVLMENTVGIDSAYGAYKNKKGKNSHSKISFSKRIVRKLENAGYYVCDPAELNSADYGVPQSRVRHFILGINESLITCPSNHPFKDLKLMNRLRINFIKQKGLNPEKKVSVKEAISDLRIDKRRKLSTCDDRPGYQQITYKGPDKRYIFQKLMHGKLNGTTPNSMALTKHRDDTILYFIFLRELLKNSGRRHNIPKNILDSYGIRKHRISIQVEDLPSPTITTLPDDILHYSEPRILTVRESARLQTFPDEFSFFGKYTTGGNSRVKECPRYTQVGNAVPPLVAEYLGELIQAVD